MNGKDFPVVNSGLSYESVTIGGVARQACHMEMVKHAS